MLRITYLLCFTVAHGHAAPGVVKESYDQNDAVMKLDGFVDKLVNRLVDKLFDTLVIQDAPEQLEYPSQAYDDTYIDPAVFATAKDLANPQADARLAVENTFVPQLFNVLRLEGGGKVHGSLARAGKVRGQTPKVAKQPPKKKPRGRAGKRALWAKRQIKEQAKSFRPKR
eukprot:gnl/MRDRNA2_/MRDRNA2_160599_c0_seq1.p1 gnl/MRDRNA2_/MRDRNA2_160599_c0~~gnl/MRDRNA2_/MRDRNA2_160599_c0_seq1.p1  ORF type:complete len:170 (-),score=42.26 gnl/MRDRNA2_/MRDRNA2_160599_c0_seq1:11-520(-)